MKREIAAREDSGGSGVSARDKSAYGSIRDRFAADGEWLWSIASGRGPRHSRDEYFASGPGSNGRRGAAVRHTCRESKRTGVHSSDNIPPAKPSRDALEPGSLLAAPVEAARCGHTPGPRPSNSMQGWRWMRGQEAVFSFFLLETVVAVMRSAMQLRIPASRYGARVFEHRRSRTVALFHGYS